MGAAVDVLTGAAHRIHNPGARTWCSSRPARRVLRRGRHRPPGGRFRPAMKLSASPAPPSRRSQAIPMARTGGGAHRQRCAVAGRPLHQINSADAALRFRRASFSRGVIQRKGDRIEGTRLRRRRVHRWPSRRAARARRPSGCAASTSRRPSSGDRRRRVSAARPAPCRLDCEAGAPASTAGSTRSTNWPPTWAAWASSTPPSARSCATTRSINLNMIARRLQRDAVPRYFFSSSVCIYRDMEPGEPEMTEADAYPALPDNEYGWEKLYAERVAQAYGRDTGMAVRIARFQNCYGPEGTWRGGREKAPAAICRKVAEVADGGRDRGLGRRVGRPVVHLRRATWSTASCASPVRPGGPGQHRLTRVRHRRRNWSHRGREGRRKADRDPATSTAPSGSSPATSATPASSRWAGTLEVPSGTGIARTYPWIKGEVHAASEVSFVDLGGGQ